MSYSIFLRRQHVYLKKNVLGVTERFTNYTSVLFLSFLDIKLCRENSEFIFAVHTELILSRFFTNVTIK